jgi:hypothetical protein
MENGFKLSQYSLLLRNEILVLNAASKFPQGKQLKQIGTGQELAFHLC